MAIPSTVDWELNQAATAGFVNGNGFDKGSTAFITNFTATVATGNAPVIASASYNFVAGDVGAWIYVKLGTNWTPGWYKITGLSGNAAIVNATIGSAVQIVAGIWTANTVAGCATTASPTAGTCGIDYSQGTAAILAATDLVIGADNTTITSVGAPFGVQHAGNCLHITAGTNFTTGWYIISTVTAGVAQLDRACGTAAATGGTGKTGGAGSLNALEDAFWEQIMGGNYVWIKGSATAYTISAGISIASTNSTATAPSFTAGYGTIRGDEPTGTNRPTFNTGTGGVTPGVFQSWRNLILTGTANGIFNPVGAGCKNIKAICTSTTAGRAAFRFTVGSSRENVGLEGISQLGDAVNISNSSISITGGYFHDSENGIVSNSSTLSLTGCLIESCKTSAINLTAGSNVINKCTLYGSSAKIGTGILLGAAASLNYVWNTIISGFVTGISQTTAQLASNEGDYNAFFNNTTDVSNFTKGKNSVALDPGFLGAVQLTGSTATTSGSVLTQSGGDFSTVADGVDLLRVVSGTGVTVGIYLITAHTATTLTVNNPLGTSSGGDVVWVVTTGHNFGIGTNLKALGFPGTFGTESTSYLDIGAVQRQEAGGGGGSGGGNFTFAG